MIPNFGMKGKLEMGRPGREVIPVFIPVWEGWRELILFGHIGFGFSGFGFAVRLSRFYVGHVYDLLMRILYDFRGCLWMGVVLGTGNRMRKTWSRWQGHVVEAGRLFNRTVGVREGALSVYGTDAFNHC